MFVRAGFAVRTASPKAEPALSGYTFFLVSMPRSSRPLLTLVTREHVTTIVVQTSGPVL